MTIPNLSTFTRVLLGLSLAVIGGLAFVLAFPPYEIWPLALFGFVPVLIAQYRIMPQKFSSLASAVGIAVWLQGYLGPVFAPIGTFMVWLPLIAGGISFLTEGGQRAFHAKTGYRWFVPAGVTGWAGSEMIRLFIPIAGTWAFIAYPFYRQLWFIQPVSIFGIIGMGMLVMMVNHVLALLLMAWLDSRWKLAEEAPAFAPGLLRGWQVTGSLVVIGWVALSLVLWSIPIGTPKVTVAAIQPDASVIVSANIGEISLAEELRERMKEQSREAAAQGAEFIVWPEGALLWDPQVDDQINLRGLAAETDAHLAVGYVVILEEGFRNEATVLNPQGEFLGVFGKDHPVVFGGETSLTRGTYPVYQTPLGVVGTIICYDLDYTDTARKLAAQGVQLIGVPSNDWGSIADKHYTHVVFRAVENRVAMVKADGGYDSAIISPYGEIIALAVFPEGGEATLVADVQIGTGNGTITTLLGDWAGWLGLVGMIFFGFGGKWLEKRAIRPEVGNG
ncbi:MAG: nitrilase-related carbon-nitrogen hydrolase [Anaerolineales bacterium]